MDETHIHHIDMAEIPKVKPMKFYQPLEWISVEDQLPAHDADPMYNSLRKISPNRPFCCLITDGNIIEIGYCVDGKWNMMGSNEHSEIESEPPYFDVTHWMEIPLPPSPRRLEEARNK